MKKKWIALSAALALSLTLGSAGVQAKPFSWTASADALSMDPYSTNNSFTNAFMNNIYEGLVRFDENIRIEPALAESWTSVSPTVWRFKLRPNVKFHGGEPMTADDVVFSWQRVQTPGSILKLSLGDVKEVRKVDALLPMIASELDTTKRNALIAEAEGIERNDVAYIPLHQQPITWAARKGVKLKQSPDNQLRLWLVTAP